jgi:hypothetical protein
MTNNGSEIAYYEFVIYNDNKTPFHFVSGLVRHITGLPLYECEELARRIDNIGKHSFGPYPHSIGTAILSEANKVISDAGYTLKVEILNIKNPEDSDVASCSFCGKSSTEVEKMFTGLAGSICDECVSLNAGKLHEHISSARLRYTYQLLDWHFGEISPDRFVKTNRNYPGRVRADLQIAIDELFTSKAIRSIGIKQQYGHEKIDLTTLWTKGRYAQALAPISYEELDIGESIPAKCQLNGLWLLQESEDRYAVVLSRESDYRGGYTIYLEISGPQNDRTAEISRKIFDGIEEIIKAAQSYRGKVLSLELSPHYGGSATGITVHKMEPVKREEIILPTKILEELERTIIQFCATRQRLRSLGLQTKRGVLFYGPPGTGKTHTIRFLATQLKDHTTFLVTAEQIGLLPEYFALARLMQPVIFVIEDADLLAKSREYLNGPQEEALLNHLLNEMDGLKEDADILFVLSSNKPQALEEALISRPGRIDQLIEFPLPNEDCRLQLMKLYGGSLNIPSLLKNDIVKRTKGVAASFVKELMRRLAQYSIERDADGNVIQTDVDQSLEEMLFSNNTLNRSVLGANNFAMDPDQ